MFAENADDVSNESVSFAERELEKRKEENVDNTGTKIFDTCINCIRKNVPKCSAYLVFRMERIKPT